MNVDATSQQFDGLPESVQKGNFSTFRHNRKKIIAAIAQNRYFRKMVESPPARKFLNSHISNFIKNIMSDNSFWTRLTGARKGGILIAQAVTGLLVLLSAPLYIQPLGIAACCALMGAGLYGVRYGLVRAWDSLEKICARTFYTFNPMRTVRVRAQNVAKKISENPLMQKIHNRTEKLTDKVAQNPRFIKFAEKPLVQKILNSRIMVLSKRGLTQKQQDVFLAGLTVQGSLAAITLCAVELTVHAAAVAAFAGGGFLALGAVAAVYVVGTNALNIFRSAIVLKKSYRARKNANKSIVVESSPEPMAATPLLEIRAKSASANTSPVFNKEAGKEEPEKSAIPQAVTYLSHNKPRL